MVSAHPMLGFETADAGLDRGAATQVPFDRFGDASFLAEDVDVGLPWRRLIGAD